VRFLLKLPHHVYYVAELFVLLSGFYIVYLLAYNPGMQKIALVIILLFYASFGIFHHKIHHTLRTRIVIEYLLISTLLFACYLFLSIG
jgi:hypothetical protein